MIREHSESDAQRSNALFIAFHPSMSKKRLEVVQCEASRGEERERTYDTQYLSPTRNEAMRCLSPFHPSMSMKRPEVAVRRREARSAERYMIREHSESDATKQCAAYRLFTPILSHISYVLYLPPPFRIPYHPVAGFTYREPSPGVSHCIPAFRLL